MKNFPFELSMKIMLNVYKKGIAKTSQFFYEELSSDGFVDEALFPQCHP